MSQMVSSSIQEAMTRASWIRKMFEKGHQLKQQFGPDNVFDLSLGNPVIEPPTEFFDALNDICEVRDKGWHRYMANSGYGEVREAVAANLNQRKIIPTDGEFINMSVGAGGGLNVLFKALLNPTDEVIILSPYFVEYLFYIQNHGGTPKMVSTQDNFDLNIEAIEQALNPKTRAIVLCSPNNPTGTIYSSQKIKELHTLLEKKSAQFGRPILLVSDEPYREIYYEKEPLPSSTWDYANSAVVYSWSKSLSIPGDRIGYIALNKNIEDPPLKDALTFCTRILGFVNAPATLQHTVLKLLDCEPPIEHYKKLRNLLVEGLDKLSIECVTPTGAFYAFPKIPSRYADDVTFIEAAQNARVLLVPGSGFGTPGHFRISYAVEESVIRGALTQLAEVV